MLCAELSETLLRNVQCRGTEATNHDPVQSLEGALPQEYMVAMECFFFEWYQDKDDEGPYGRTHVSNNTEAVEKSMKEGQVSRPPLFAFTAQRCSAPCLCQHK